MKKVFFQIIAFLITITSIYSCTEDKEFIGESIGTHHKQPIEMVQEIEKQVLASGKSYTIEAATLEELNASLKANGLKEVSKEEVEKAKQRLHQRTTWACATWVALGDWNGDSSLSVSDLTAARNWLCDNAGGSDPCYSEVVNINSCSPCPPSAGINFAWLSGLGYDTYWNILGDSDIDAGTYRILGLIPCY